MSLFKSTPKKLSRIIFHWCVLTFVLFIALTICSLLCMETSDSPLWGAGPFIVGFGIHSFFAAFSVHKGCQYMLQARQKPRNGMLLAAMLGISSAFSLFACWVWNIGLGVTYMQGTWERDAPISFMINGFMLYGGAWLGALGISAVTTLLRKLISLSPGQRVRRILNGCIQVGCIGFWILTTAVLLYGLKRLVQPTIPPLSRKLIASQTPTVILYICMAVIAGMDLFFGARCLLKGTGRKAGVGAALFALGYLSCFIIWFQTNTMLSPHIVGSDRTFCLTIGVFQMTITLLLHGIVAFLNRKAKLGTAQHSTGT